MNSVLDDDDDIVPLEPPLGPRLCSTKDRPRSLSPLNRNISFDYHNNEHQHRNSGDCGYDSDRIDPELEELLYTSIHHQTIDSMEVSSFFDSSANRNEDQPQPVQDSTPKKMANSTSTTTDFTTLKTPPDNYCAIFNNRKVVKKDLKRLKKAKDAATSAAQFKIDRDSKLDLSFGNLVVKDGSLLDQASSILSPVEAMNKFYNEDDYDSDLERAKMKRMPSDRRFWKVGQEDMLSNFGRRSGTSIRSGRRQQCRQCGGNGHLVKDCPRVKKSIYFTIDSNFYSPPYTETNMLHLR